MTGLSFALPAEVRRPDSGLTRVFWGRGADGALVWADDLWTAARALGARRLWRPALHEYLRMGDVSAPATMLQGVQALPAGWRLEAAGPVAAPGPAAPAPATFDEAVHELHARLAHGVQAALAGARRPAAFLSGGVDSALLCALAARHRRDLVAVTVAFEGAAHDESAAAARVAAHLGLRHEVLRPDMPTLRRAFERLAPHMDQPTADPALPATVVAFEHCRERHDVVLDGTGADELLGALPPRHVRIAVQYASLVPRRARLALARALRATPGLAGQAPILDFEHPADTLIRWHGFTRREIEALCGEPVCLAHTHFHQTFARHARSAHFERCTALLDAMPCERLTQAQRTTGLDVRFPFWDEATAALLRGLPADWRAPPGEPKRILRAVLARQVPRALWERPKQGFSFPLAAFLADSDHRLVRRHLLAWPWGGHGLPDARAVQALARRFMAGEQALAFRAWALTVLDAWLQAHGTQIEA